MVGFAFNGLMGMGNVISDMTSDEKIDGRSYKTSVEGLSNMSRVTALGGSMPLSVVADMAAIGVFASIYALAEKGSGFEDYEARNPNSFIKFVAKQLSENAQYIPGGHLLGYHLQELINRDTQVQKTGEPTSHGILDLMKPKESSVPVQQTQEEIQLEQQMQQLEQQMEGQMQGLENQMKQLELEQFRNN
jgi:hypothetical protein